MDTIHHEKDYLHLSRTQMKSAMRNYDDKMNDENQYAISNGLVRMRNLRSESTSHPTRSGFPQCTPKHQNLDRYAVPNIVEVQSIENNERDWYIPTPTQIKRRESKAGQNHKENDWSEKTEQMTSTSLQAEIKSLPLSPISKRESYEMGKQFEREKDDSRYSTNQQLRTPPSRRVRPTAIKTSRGVEYVDHVNQTNNSAMKNPTSPWLSHFTDSLCFRNNAVVTSPHCRPFRSKKFLSHLGEENNDAYLLQSVKRQFSPKHIKYEASRNQDIHITCENIISDLKESEKLHSFLVKEKKTKSSCSKVRGNDPRSSDDESLSHSTGSENSPIVSGISITDTDSISTTHEPLEFADIVNHCTVFSMEHTKKQRSENQQNPIKKSKVDEKQKQSVVTLRGPNLGTFQNEIKSTDDIYLGTSLSSLLPEFVGSYSAFRMDDKFVEDIMNEIKCSIPFFHKYMHKNNPIQTLNQQKQDSICSEPVARCFKVRGTSYLNNGQKVPSAEAMFALIGTDFFRCKGKSESNKHMSKKDNSFLHRLGRLCQQKHVLAPFLIVINFITPFGNLLSYFYRPDSEGNALNHNRRNEPAENLWKQFLNGDETYRNSRLKFIPNVQAGPWMIKKLVGSKPALIGQKIPTTYYGSIEDNYIEICFDVTQGGTLANSICSSCAGKSDIISVDLCFLLEGQESHELPEQILAALRVHHIKVKSCPTLDEWNQNL